MIIVKTVENLKLLMSEYSNVSIGFVPTMGALHQGHIKILESSKSENDISVVSIFVNPLQFNNYNDFKLYPRDNDKDIELLEKNGCDVLFLPEDDNILNKMEEVEIDLGNLELLLEGEKRPGHFKGVVSIVNHLFKIVKPHKAYFGQKDFQQVCVVKKLVLEKNIPIIIREVATERSEMKLALSSRNLRLSNENLIKASLVSQKILSLKNRESFYVNEVRNEFNDFLISLGFQLEYFEVVDSESFVLCSFADSSKKCVACIAYFVGEVRLIDNVFLFD
jgi:pantoate--beta-alanine ligase